MVVARLPVECREAHADDVRALKSHLAGGHHEAHPLAGGGQRPDPFADADYLKLFAGFMRDGSPEQEARIKTAQKLGVRAAMRLTWA